MSDLTGVCVVIPALDEEGSIGAVVARLVALGVPRVLVADNGSRDRTAAVAAAAGAIVIPAPQRGYGSACLSALAAVPPETRAVAFCDADGADDLTRFAALVTPVLDGTADLVIGSRVLGHSEAGALTWPQRAGNLVSAALMRLLYRVRVTDLGPFRCIAWPAYQRLGMSDPAYGWTAEMQVKAFRLRLRVQEIAVNAKVRTAGTSKISGRWWPVVRAGWAIITTILRHAQSPLPVQAPVTSPDQSA